jgi:hypothetical protein
MKSSSMNYAKIEDLLRLYVASWQKGKPDPMSDATKTALSNWLVGKAPEIKEGELWALANFYRRSPDPKAAAPLKAAAVRMGHTLRTASNDENTRQNDRRALYPLETAFGALLAAAALCAARDAKYVSFQKEQRVVDKAKKLRKQIEVLEKEAKPKRERVQALYQEHEKLRSEDEAPDFNQLNAQWRRQERFSRMNQLGNEIEQLGKELRAIQARTRPLHEEHEQLMDGLSIAWRLLFVLRDGQSYGAYIRQHALTGLYLLLEESHLDEPSRESLRTDMEAATSREEETKEDDSLRTVEVRLWPGSRIGEANFLLANSLKYLKVIENDQVFSPKLREVTDCVYRLLPDAIQFFEQFPLRLMPEKEKHKMAEYRESSYHLGLWTRYTPPLYMGPVIFRYLEVSDYSLPNSIGMVYSLFEHPWQAVPVLFHEYLHFQGKKNEAEVWLREHLFLRKMIMENEGNGTVAGKSKAGKSESSGTAARWQQALDMFVPKRDYITAVLLCENLEDPSVCHALNRVITQNYGHQKNREVAANEAATELQRENTNIFISNLMQTWDRHIPYPTLNESPQEEQTMRKILVARKMQRNTLSDDEYRDLVAEPDNAALLNEWKASMGAAPAEWHGRPLPDLSKLADLHDFFKDFGRLLSIAHSESPEAGFFHATTQLLMTVAAQAPLAVADADEEALSDLLFGVMQANFSQEDLEAHGGAATALVGLFVQYRQVWAFIWTVQEWKKEGGDFYVFKP